jgi:hypothetical protein
MRAARRLLYAPARVPEVAGTDPVIRGLLLDLLATGDRDRVQDAAESFLATLEHQAPPPEPHGRAVPALE